MTRSNTPGTTAGTRNSNKDYSLCAEPADAPATDSTDAADALDDDLGAEGLSSALARAPAQRGQGAEAADEAPRIVTVAARIRRRTARQGARKTLPGVFRAAVCKAGSKRNGCGSTARRRRSVSRCRSVRPIELVPDLLPEPARVYPRSRCRSRSSMKTPRSSSSTKPAGLVVHPAAGNWSGTVLNGLLHRYGDAAAGLPRAGIGHRLDKRRRG